MKCLISLSTTYFGNTLLLNKYLIFLSSLRNIVREEEIGITVGMGVFMMTCF